MSVIKIPQTEEVLALLGDMEAAELRSAGEWTDELIERAEKGREILGESLPWDKTSSLFRLRPSEITVWAGQNGARKSFLTGMVACWLARTSPVCIMSLEMKPTETLYRMAHQASGTDRPARDWMRSFGAWADNRIWVYDQLDSIPPDRILGAVYYAAKQLGCKHIFIDSLAKCGTGDDPVVEKAFIDRLAWAAKTLEIHVHLIAHVRKPQGQTQEYIPSKHDILGTSHTANLVDNIAIVYKSQIREQAIYKRSQGFEITDKEQEAIDKSADHLLIIDKQRHGDWEGKISLYFDRDTLQFKGDDTPRQLPFTIPMKRAS